MARYFAMPPLVATFCCHVVRDALSDNKDILDLTGSQRQAMVWPENALTYCDQYGKNRQKVLRGAHDGLD